MADRLAEIEARLDESPDAAWPQPWGMEAEVKGDGHWDNEFHVNTEGGEGGHLATFQYRCHAEMFAAAPTDLRDLLAVVKAAKDALRAHECDECVEDCTGFHCPCEWHAEMSGAHNPTCHDDVREAQQVLRGALANLEGGEG